MPPRAVCGILSRLLGLGSGGARASRGDKLRAGGDGPGVGWHLPSIKASRRGRLMEGGSDAALFRLRYSCIFLMILYEFF